MIFEDPTRLRWKTALVIFIVMSVIGLFLLADFTIGLITNPPLPRFYRLQDEHGKAISTNVVDQEINKQNIAKPIPSAQRPSNKRGVSTHAYEKTLPLFSTKSFITSAFIVQDDPRSIMDLKNNIRHLDIAFPDWYSFSTSDGAIHEKIDTETARILSSNHVLNFPRLSNTDSKGVWREKEVSLLLRNEQASRLFINTLVKKLLHEHAQGINIDIENLDPADREVYLDWLENLIEVFHRNQLYVTVDIPLNDPAFDYEVIGRLADAVVVMGYDEHFAGGKPGPIAGMNWFNDGVDEMAKRIPPRKLIIGLGAYGYDWNVSSRKSAQPMGFAEAMILADEVGAEVETEKTSLNNSFSYQDQTGAKHEVWFLDAVTAWNQFLTVRQNKIFGTALWRLGLEEPGVWNFLSRESLDTFQPADLKEVKSLQAVSFKGEGEILKVRELPQDGKRALSFDGRLIDHSTYESLPKYFVVENFGHSAEPRIALTFDDGPDAKWTPKILRILKQNGVHATFFVVGDQAQRTPATVRQEHNEGHLLGNHTFLHPNIQTVSEMRLKIELNATQRLIESIVGRQTLLFRAPYDVDSTPTQPKELIPLYTVCQLGYIVVCADIDSEDYAKPGTDQIVQNVVKKLEETGSNIIIMHDGGGNRKQTVEALEILIPLLKKAGYKFVTVNELLGVPMAALMPAISFSEHLVILGNEILNWLRTWGWFLLVSLFFVTTAIAVVRIMFLGIFVFLSHKRQQYTDKNFTPPVGVLVPAYNEGKVIRRTLEALLKSDYPDFNIMVVDDGSTDDTAGIVLDLAKIHPQIRLVSKPNGGKDSALNLGFHEAQEEYIVTIDADTIVMPETIRHLIAPFADKNVDAVCGNVQVGNVKNILTAFQNVEYVTSQNYDRRAFDALNCISVVPGATGAWKRESVLRVGGYSDHTLTEDADLTLTLLEHGGRIVYAPLAKSITEAPENIRALFTQRFRWSFGTFQCLWKHRGRFGKGGLGWIALPNMLLFQVIFPVLSPIGDLVLLLSLFRGDYGAILNGYILFVLMDLTGSLIAFTLDKKNLWQVWVVLVQRFFYRQFMYLVAFRSLVAAIKGRRHGWNKLERKASVGGAQSVSQPLSA